MARPEWSWLGSGSAAGVSSSRATTSMTPASLAGVRPRS